MKTILVSTGEIDQFRAAERLAGARGKFFFRGPYLKNFLRKNFFRKQPPPPVDNFLGKKIFRTSTLQLFASAFTSIFHNKFGYFAPQKNILPFARKDLTQKNDWGPTKIF
jgi:hypothetical protein